MLTTEEVLNHHLSAIGDADLEEILTDYTEESALILGKDVIRGIDSIRPLFKRFVTEVVPPGSHFEISSKEIQGDVAYIVWNAESEKFKISLGTDTFIIREGKILIQTVTLVMQEKK